MTGANGHQPTRQGGKAHHLGGEGQGEGIVKGEWLPLHMCSHQWSNSKLNTQYIECG